MLLLNTLILKYLWEIVTQFYHLIIQLISSGLVEKISVSSQICDYYYLSIIITVQSTNKLLSIIINQIFLLAGDWSQRVT